MRVTPETIWGAWRWEAGLLPGLLLGALYVLGCRAVWRSAGFGRGVRPWRALCFAAGLATLLLALASPLDALGGVLFAGHMVQHLVLVQVAAPLIVLGAPQVALAWGLPRWLRRGVSAWWRAVAPEVRSLWRLLAHPAAAWCLHATALWLWHAPALYQAALRSAPLHALEHASFFGTALLFWWSLMRRPAQGGPGYGAAALYTFTMMLQSGLLGALMTFAPAPWYPAQSLGAAAWGLTPLEDQQLAGLIMWVPAGVIYVAALVAFLGVWLMRSEVAERAGRLADLRGGEL
jgi:putative membrane protein